MNNSIVNNNPKNYGRIAGVLYLLIALIGGFSIGYMPGKIVMPTDAHQTFQNLHDYAFLFRVGITGDVFVIIFEMVLTILIYQLFKKISPTSIKIATYSRIAMAIIMGINLLNYMIPMLILNQSGYLDAFTPSQLESFTLLFLNVHKFGELTWQLFFALHLVGLGYTVYKANFTPKYLGVLLIIGSLGYGGDVYVQLMGIDSAWVSILFSCLLALAVIGELWFAFWLLIKGLSVEQGQVSTK